MPAKNEDARPVFVPVYISVSDGTMLQTRKKTPKLFLLMTVLSQTFLALVCGHLMAFSFLSAGHLSTL